MDNFHPEWFGGDRNAAKFIADLCQVAHLWDDLIDRDTELSEADINKAFTLALVTIPANPFYQANLRELSPLMFSGILGYVTANTLERSGDSHSIEIAHGLRYAAANVAAYVVAITNTESQAQEILPIAWKSWMPERFADYAKEHLNAE